MNNEEIAEIAESIENSKTENGGHKKLQQTLCWDCRRATGGCPWSDHLRPIKGWTAVPTKKGTPFASYIVLECPGFIRDAYSSGLKRYKKEDPLIQMIEAGFAK